jgi:hypothetical protein
MPNPKKILTEGRLADFTRNFLEKREFSTIEKMMQYGDQWVNPCQKIFIKAWNLSQNKKTTFSISKGEATRYIILN